MLSLHCFIECSEGVTSHSHFTMWLLESMVSIVFWLAAFTADLEVFQDIHSSNTCPMIVVLDCIHGT